MRERLIKTIFDYWEGNHPGADWDDAEWDHGKLSDAILAALPSMLKPLKWEVVSEKRWDAESMGILYKVRCIEGAWMSFANGVTIGYGHCLVHGAVEVANISNRDAIMAAFGIEVKP